MASLLQRNKVSYKTPPTRLLGEHDYVRQSSTFHACGKGVGWQGEKIGERLTDTD